MSPVYNSHHVAKIYLIAYFQGLIIGLAVQNTHTHTRAPAS